MRRKAQVVVLVAVAFGCAGAAPAHAETAATVIQLVGPAPASPASARAIALDRAAGRLLHQATHAVEARRPSCAPKPFESTPGTTHDAPSNELLGTIGVLRRPALPEEGAGSKLARFAAPGGTLYADYVRRVATAAGTHVVIVVDRGTLGLTPPSASCMDAEQAELTAMARSARPAVRRLALRRFAQQRTAYANLVAEPVHDRIYAFLEGPHGVSGGGGGGDLAAFLSRGTFATLGGKHSSTAIGVVPDGVATITMQFPRRVSLGPRYKPVVFPSALRLTVPVRDNAFAVHIPRGAGQAFPTRAVWRDAAGNVLRVVTTPNVGLPTG